MVSVFQRPSHLTLSQLDNMFGFVKMIMMLLLAAVVMAGEYSHGGGHGGGHGHGHATSYQNYVLHSYHPVPVYYKKGHGHH